MKAVPWGRGDLNTKDGLHNLAAIIGIKNGLPQTPLGVLPRRLKCTDSTCDSGARCVGGAQLLNEQVAGHTEISGNLL